MAYSTGSVNNPAALQTVIENFAVANGFTLNAGAGSWLTKGSTHVQLSTPITSDYLDNPIVLTNNGTGLANINCPNGHNVASGTSVTISGAADAAYNGTVVVTAVDVNNLTYAIVGTPPSPTTGIIVIKGSLNTLSIQGANSSNGLTEPCTLRRCIYIPVVNWPVTYYMYYNASPDLIVCVLYYDSNKIQYIVFGDYVKMHSSAFTGGNWYFASRIFTYASELAYAPDLYSFSDTQCEFYYDSCIPFIARDNMPQTPVLYQSTPIHAKIDGDIWNISATSPSNPTAHLAKYSHSLLFRSPNTWNNQTHLVPIHINILTTQSDPYSHYIGYIEHFRLIRVDNYVIGDSETIGTDVWDIYPFHIKDTTYRNGDAGVRSAKTGTLGFAVRKT
jgi:hypothetical protein